jgi:hypothetical protein
VQKRFAVALWTFPDIVGNRMKYLTKTRDAMVARSLK